MHPLANELPFEKMLYSPQLMQRTSISCFQWSSAVACQVADSISWPYRLLIESPQGCWWQIYLIEICNFLAMLLQYLKGNPATFPAMIWHTVLPLHAKLITLWRIRQDRMLLYMFLQASYMVLQFSWRACWSTEWKVEINSLQEDSMNIFGSGTNIKAYAAWLHTRQHTMTQCIYFLPKTNTGHVLIAQQFSSMSLHRNSLQNELVVI